MPGLGGRGCASCWESGKHRQGSLEEQTADLAYSSSRLSLSVLSPSSLFPPKQSDGG